MIYFDNGATSLPKPSAVLQAACRAAGLGNPGRGGHRLSLEAARMLYDARERAAMHFEVPSAENVCFFSGATEGLCRVIKSLVPPKGEILISDMEHNAVRRPALALKKKGVTLSVFRGYGKKEEIVASFLEKLKRKPDLVVMIHTSNICPQTLPVGTLCGYCKKQGVLSLVDGAQAGGHLPLSLKGLQADGLCLPGHKGLLGLQGSGVLLCSDELKRALEQADTLVEGGSGSASVEEQMPAFLPERLEAGTQPLPAIASMWAGLGFIEQRGYSEISYRLTELYKRCKEGLSVIKGVRLIAPKAEGIGPLSFDLPDFENAAFSDALSRAGVCVREGLHCAPLAHQTVGSIERGGIRVSFSLFNKQEQVDAFLRILQDQVRFFT